MKKDTLRAMMPIARFFALMGNSNYDDEGFADPILCTESAMAK